MQRARRDLGGGIGNDHFWAGIAWLMPARGPARDTHVSATLDLCHGLLRLQRSSLRRGLARGLGVKNLSDGLHTRGVPVGLGRFLH